MAWWGRKTLGKCLPLPCSKDSESSHNAVMGPALPFCLEQLKNQAEYMKHQFKNTGHQAIKDSHPQETGNKVSPTTASAYCLERVPRLQHKDRESRQSLTESMN